MKLIQIQYFLTIAECRSITKAAEALYVSQPAVTKQMNALEKELGVKLMQRTPHGIELTEVGAEFAKDCRLVLEDLEQAVTKAVNAGKKNLDVLRIGCFDGAVIEDFLPDLLTYFRSAFPDMKVKLGRHTFTENRKALRKGSIDMLIELRFPDMAEDPFLNDCDVRVLSVRKGALIYSRYSPLAKKESLVPQDFAEEIFYSVPQKDGVMLKENTLRTLRSIGIPEPKMAEAENFPSLMSNVRMGMGYTILAQQAADTNPDLRALELPAHLGLEVVAVWKKESVQVRKLMQNYKR